jgi:hypothetical protein
VSTIADRGAALASMLVAKAIDSTIAAARGVIDNAARAFPQVSLESTASIRPVERRANTLVFDVTRMSLSGGLVPTLTFVNAATHAIDRLVQADDVNGVG